MATATLIEMNEMSTKEDEFKENKPLGDQNYTSSELGANSEPTREDQNGDDERGRRRIKKWRLISAIIDWRRCLRKNPEEVKRRIRHGVPDSFRPAVWQIISGGREIPSENPAVHYEELITYEVSELENLSIVKDIPRTLKSLALSQTYSGPLYNVLKAYDVYDRARGGYIWGMSYIAALLLLYMNEESAFWTMAAMLTKPAMHGIYSGRPPLLEQYLFQFEMLVKEQLPSLDQHFEEQRIVPSMYARRWFLTVFSADLPIPLVVRIWDVFLYEGISTVFQVGLALLKFFEKDLLILSKQKLIEFLATLKTKRPLHEDILFPMAFSFDVQKMLPELELEYSRTSGTLQKFLLSSF